MNASGSFCHMRLGLLGQTKGQAKGKLKDVKRCFEPNLCWFVVEKNKEFLMDKSGVSAVGHFGSRNTADPTQK